MAAQKNVLTGDHASTSGELRAYVAPALVCHGTLAALTQHHRPWHNGGGGTGGGGGKGPGKNDGRNGRPSL